MAWGPIAVGGQTFYDTDFAPFAFAATWERFLNALAKHLADNASLTGLQSAASVAGTGTAYTFTTTVAVADKTAFFFVPHVTNADGATGAANAGAAWLFQTSDGSAVTAGVMEAGKRYLVQRNGSQLVVVGLDLIQRFIQRVRMVGAAATLDFLASDADINSPQVRLSLNAGRLLINQLGQTAVELQADGDLRLLLGKFLNGNSQELFHPGNPPTPNDNLREMATRLITPFWEGAAEPTLIDTTRPYCVSGPDIGRQLRVTVAGAFIDFEAMPNSTEIVVQVMSGASAVAYSGYTGLTWFGTASSTRLSFPSQGMWRVLRGQGWIMATQTPAYITTSATAVPTYARKWAWSLSQSWGDREMKNGLRGVQAALKQMALNSDVLSVQNVAFGASAISRYAPSDATNYWVDMTANAGAGGPGPNLTAAVTAFGAAPASPALEAVISMLGHGDFSIFAASGSLPTALSPATMKAAYLYGIGYLRTALSLPNLKLFVCPLGAREVATGTYPENKFWPLRRAQLDLVAEGTNVHRGPDWYDLPMPDGVHLGFDGQREHGARVAKFITNAINGKTNFLGARISGFARTAAKTYVFTINPGTGASLQRPTAPFGFAVLAGGTDWGAPLEVVQYDWGTSGANTTLTVTTKTDDLTAVPAYPYGSADMRDPSRIVRSKDPVTEEWMPLQTYHPTA